LTLACAGVFELMGLGLRLPKSTFDGENFMCRLSWSISSHFVPIHSRNVRYSPPPKCEKYAKTPLFGVQGHSKSSMLIKLKSSSPLLVMIGNISVPICNRFHTRRANSGKMTSFRGYPSLTPSFESNLFTQHRQISSQ